MSSGCPQDQGCECGCQICQRAAEDRWDNEARWRFRQVIEILAEIDLANLQRLHEAKRAKAEAAQAALDDTLSPQARKRLQRQQADAEKRYNLSHTARALGVSRQTIYDWIQKGWVAPKRDHRHYPVFTVVDIERIIDWRVGLREPMRERDSSASAVSAPTAPTTTGLTRSLATEEIAWVFPPNE